MPRSVNNVASRRRRKKIIRQAKGYFSKRKNVYTVAKNAVEKSMQYAYVGRKQKKRDYRYLWTVRINAAARQHGLNYAQFMDKLRKADLNLNRKVLADMAMNDPKAFESLVASVR